MLIITQSDSKQEVYIINFPFHFIMVNIFMLECSMIYIYISLGVKMSTDGAAVLCFVEFV